MACLAGCEATSVSETHLIETPWRLDQVLLPNVWEPFALTVPMFHNEPGVPVRQEGHDASLPVRVTSDSGTLVFLSTGAAEYRVGVEKRARIVDRVRPEDATRRFALRRRYELLMRLGWRLQGERLSLTFRDMTLRPKESWVVLGLPPGSTRQERARLAKMRRELDALDVGASEGESRRGELEGRLVGRGRGLRYEAREGSEAVTFSMEAEARR